MNKEVYFRKAMRGFNKSDVIDYIEKTSLENRTTVEELTKKLSEAEKKIEDMTRELEEIKMSNQAELSDPLEQAPNEEEILLREKADKYDKISAQLADIILNAEKNAAEIISSAHSTAEEHVKEINEKIKGLNSAMMQKRNMIAASKLEMSRILADISSSVEDLCNKSNSLYAKIDTDKNETNS